jgi:DNA-binding NarL/FixJ family response regulator
LQPIRVVTGELPRILSDIIGTVLESAGDIRVVGEAVNHAELLELTRSLRPDVVIMGLDESGLPGFGWDLYAGDPLLRVLGVMGEGRQTFVYELRPHRTPLGELSPEELVAAVRRMADARSSASIGSNGIGA